MLLQASCKTKSTVDMPCIVSQMIIGPFVNHARAHYAGPMHRRTGHITAAV